MSYILKTTSLSKLDSKLTKVRIAFTDVRNLLVSISPLLTRRLGHVCFVGYFALAEARAWACLFR